MPLKVVPFKEFYSLIKTIVNERPDFTYNRTVEEEACVYRMAETLNGKSRCVIGEALHRLGMDDEELTDLDDNANGTINVAASYVLDRLGFDPDTCSFGQTLQSYQDEGTAWGESFENATRQCGLSINA